MKKLLGLALATVLASSFALTTFAQEIKTTNATADAKAMNGKEKVGKKMERHKEMKECMKEMKKDKKDMPKKEMKQKCRADMK